MGFFYYKLVGNNLLKLQILFVCKERRQLECNVSAYCQYFRWTVRIFGFYAFVPETLVIIWIYVCLFHHFMQHENAGRSKTHHRQNVKYVRQTLRSLCTFILKYKHFWYILNFVIVGHKYLRTFGNLSNYLHQILLNLKLYFAHILYTMTSICLFIPQSEFRLQPVWKVIHLKNKWCDIFLPYHHKF